MEMLWVMVVNSTFNNISVISWWSVLLVGETGVPGENHWPAASHCKFYHIMLYRVHLAWAGFELTMFVVIGTDCIGTCKSNYHTITTATASEMLCISIPVCILCSSCTIKWMVNNICYLTVWPMYQGQVECQMN